MIIAASLFLTVTLHRAAIYALPPSPTLEIGGLQQLAGGKPVVVTDEQTFFELQYYRSSRDLQFHFLLPSGQDHPIGMMATVADRGYFPGSFDHVDFFEQTHAKFLAVATTVPGRPPLGILDTSSCHARQIGAVTINSSQAAVYEMTGCLSGPHTKKRS